MADAENSQNYQFGRKKQLLIPAPQDEIVKGMNGKTPKILNRVQHTSAKTQGGGGSHAGPRRSFPSSVLPFRMAFTAFSFITRST